MSDLFFFTDLDLLDSLDSSASANAQTAADAFGPQSDSTFRLNSKHKSNSSVHPKAYAVVKGYVLIHPIPDDAAHVNLILIPYDQPGGKEGLGLPRIKYLVYRNVRKSSLIVSGSNPEKFVAAGDIDMVDKIRGSYKFSSSAEVPVNLFTTWGILQAQVLLEGLSIFSLPTMEAGMSIGKFDATGFSFEIVLDDLGFSGDQDFFSRDFDSQSLWTIPAGSGTAADRFSTRAKKEYVLHFLDPCAFYANSYFSGPVTAKKSDAAVIKVKGAKRAQRNDPANDISQILAKFNNQDKAYVDLRNENDHSFNYYSFVDDPNKNFYSIYPDTVDLEFINNADTLPAPLTNYGSSNWPLLIVKNSDFKSGNTEEKNVLSIKLPKGNNENAVLFVSIGIKNEGALADPLELESGHTFHDLKLQSGATSYDAFELVVPNNKPKGTTAIIPTYSRLKYIRRIATVDLFEDPADTEVQYLDNIFTPLLLKDKLSGISGPSALTTSVYENEQYVDLTNGDQISETEFVGNVGIAVSDNNVTLFCYALFEKGRSSSRKSKKHVQTTSRSISSKELIAEFSAAGERGNPFMIDKLTLTPDQPKIVYYQRPKKLFPRFRDDDYDNLLMLIVDKNNFNTKIIAPIRDSTSASQFSPEFDVHLVIKDQTHRDLDKTNDKDASTDKKTYTKCSLFLKGFKLVNGNITLVEVDTGIQLYSKMEDFKVYPILKDEDAVLDTPASNFLPFECGFLVNDPAAIRPKVHLPYKDIMSASYLTHYSNLGEFFNNIYEEDLIEFITRLYQSAATDASSKRLYQYVFSKFIKTQSSPDSQGLFPPDPALPKIELAVVDGKVSHGDKLMHQGLLLEAANYLAVWKIAQNLKHINALFKNTTFFMGATVADSATFESRYNLIVPKYPFVNNLLESLKSAGIRPPLEVLEELKKEGSAGEAKVFPLHQAFSEMIRQDKTGQGVVVRVRDYYNSFGGGSLGSKITYAHLSEALEGFNASKQQYINQLSSCIYEGLGGTLRDYTFANVGLGDGTMTLGLFGDAGDGSEVGGEGVFLFNYFFEKVPGDTSDSGNNIKTREILHIPNLDINDRNDESFLIHFGIYGIDEREIKHDVRIQSKGIDKGGFTLELEHLDGEAANHSPANLSITSLVPSIPSLGTWDNFTKDIIIEKPKTNAYTSTSLTLDSKSDEESFCIVLYKTPDPLVLQYAKSFTDLFVDDYYQLTPSKVARLWEPPEEEIRSMFIDLLKGSAGGAQFKMKLMVGGGIGRLKLPASLKDYKKTPNYPNYSFRQDDSFCFNEDIYKCLADTASDPNQDPDNWFKMEFVTGHAYLEGDFAKYSNRLFRANHDVSDTSSNPAANPTEWVESFPYFDPLDNYPQGSVVIHNERLYRSLKDVVPGAYRPAQWIIESVVETDPDYVFNPSSSGAASDPWVRVKNERANKPDGGTLADIQDSRLRYSYASMVHDLSTNEIAITVESYASPLVSSLLTPKTVPGPDGPTVTTGLNPNQQLCLPISASLRSHNQLLSALRSCGLLDAILESIRTKVNDTEGASIKIYLAGDPADSNKPGKISLFKAGPDAKVMLSPDGPGVAEDELNLVKFNKIISNNCP